MKTLTQIGLYLLIFILSGHRYLYAEKNLISCMNEEGTKKETRQIESFTGIRVGGAFEVYITQTGSCSVVVEADERVIEYISTEVEDGTLKIYMKKGPGPCFDHVKTMKIYLTVGELKSLDLSGAVELKMENQLKTAELELDGSGAVEVDLKLDVQKMDVEISGACELSLIGTVGDLNIEGSGASELDAFNCTANNVAIYISGATEATVNATGTLKVKASGACDVRYKGNASVDVYTSGASSVKKVE